MERLDREGRLHFTNEVVFASSVIWTKTRVSRYSHYGATFHL